MVDIVQLKQADAETSEQIHALIQQLDEQKSCTPQHLQGLVESPTAELWVAREGGKIVGMATLTLATRISGLSARMDDVVVDASQRGKGVGKSLCEKIIERARTRGARSLHLTSRPSREAANKLYQKLGFRLHETNSYQIRL
ncbi:MAG: GNAT family N-acetyltransferase [Patescibacteria group bacterium]